MLAIVPTFLAGLLVAAVGAAGGAEPAAQAAAPEAPAASGPAVPTGPGLLPPPPVVSVAMDTIRVTATLPPGAAPARSAPPSGTETLRDPRHEPLFVQYARPVHLIGLADRLDLDRVRWRYAPPAGGE